MYKERHKDLKIIIILRNPAERAWSNFMMHRQYNIEPLDDFQEACKPSVIQQRLNDNWSISFDYIGWGMYYEQVKAFTEEFKNVKILLYDRFCENSTDVVREMFSFLEVDAGAMPDTATRYNVAGNIKPGILAASLFKQNPVKSFFKLLIPYKTRQKLWHKILKRSTDQGQMPADIRKDIIRQYYEDDILNLQRLIKQDIALWLKN